MRKDNEGRAGRGKTGRVDGKQGRASKGMLLERGTREGLCHDSDYYACPAKSTPMTVGKTVKVKGKASMHNIELVRGRNVLLGQLMIGDSDVKPNFASSL